MSQRNGHLDGHLARLLLVLRHFGPTTESRLTGLTKLAKIDFLLRYPAFTERLLANRGSTWELGAQPDQSEELAVENRMIRYKYGPWDDRYYVMLGALSGMGLVEVSRQKSTLEFSLTLEGRRLSDAVASQDEWSVIDQRARFLSEEFNVSGTALRKLIYSELPDVVDRPLRSRI